MKYSVLIIYQATPLWLRLTRDERGVFFEKKVAPLIQKFHPSLAIRLFDSEAFHASISDFMLVECDNLKDYYFFMEHVRDTELFGKPYIVLKDVVVGMENGFQLFTREN
jgi:hypothetical protein